MTKISFTYEQAADKIAGTGWTNPVTVPLTYGFRSSDASNPNFVKFDSAQIAAAEEALKLWSDVANIKFERVGTGTSGTGAYSNSATILFSSDTSAGGYAWGYNPGSRGFTDLAGDVFINPTNGWFTNFSRGSYDFMTIVHEIGHAIGLDHPGSYNGGNPTYAVNALYAEDSMQYTVMSYFDAEETGAQHFGTYAATPLLHDIAAAQLLYGANMSTRTGSTVYGFHSNADRSEFHIDSPAADVVFAVWDAGGKDTFDFSGYSANATINLNAATFSSVGGLKDNIAIAKGATIEDAIGGAGFDKLLGNAVANTLDGGGGNDQLYGNGGGDTLKGGAGNDFLYGGAGVDFLHGGSGSDNFVFNTAIGGAGIDRILEFAPLYDTIRLENGLYLALGAATGTLAAGKFYTGASAHDADDRIVYDRTTGAVAYDADGSGAGAAIRIAVLTSAVKPALTAADFHVI